MLRGIRAGRPGTRFAWALLVVAIVAVLRVARRISSALRSRPHRGRWRRADRHQRRHRGAAARRSWLMLARPRAAKADNEPDRETSAAEKKKSRDLGPGLSMISQQIEFRSARLFCGYGFLLFFFFRSFFLRALARLLVLLFQLRADEFENGQLGAVTDAPTGADDPRVTAGTLREARREIREKFLSSRPESSRMRRPGGEHGANRAFPSVIIFSAIGRAAFARRIVVWMRSFSMRFVTRLRSTARRCAGCLPSLEPDLRCLMIQPRLRSPKRLLPAEAAPSGSEAEARSRGRDRRTSCRDSDPSCAGCP